MKAKLGDLRMKVKLGALRMKVQLGDLSLDPHRPSPVRRVVVSVTGSAWPNAVHPFVWSSTRAAHPSPQRSPESTTITRVHGSDRGSSAHPGARSTLGWPPRMVVRRIRLRDRGFDHKLC